MKKLFSIIVVLITAISVYGQTSDKEQSSLILALDVRSDIGRYLSYDVRFADCYYLKAKHGKKAYKEYYSSEIQKILTSNSVMPNYVSGVLYGKKQGAERPTNFSRLVVSPSKASKNYSDLLNQLYKELPSGEYYSITSFARPYSLMALKEQQSTNRTFLVILTDGRYNGNDDYYGEVRYMKTGFNKEGEKQFKEDILNVQTNYFCQFKEQIEVDGGYIQLYEFIPLQQYFALESVLDFPHEIMAKRGKSNYVVDFTSNAITNEDYEVKRMQISLVTNGGAIRTENFSPNENVKFEISKREIDNVHLKIKAWVKLYDGVYNNTILHPNGSKLQGASGLYREIQIQKEDNAKILGVIELHDFLFAMSFWTSSQEIAATTWGWIFILIILAISILIIYKSNIYKVKEGTIKI